MRALEIGALIKRLLADMSINDRLKGRIYPVVAEQKTPFSFVTYKRSGVVLESDKDVSYRYGMISVDIIIVGSSYSQSLDIASAIVDEMPDYPMNLDGFDISDIKLANAVEDFQDEAYIQALTFNIVIDN